MNQHGTNIWTPQGVEFLGGEELARAEETGEMALSFKGQWECPKCFMVREITVAAEESVSTDQLEDIFGAQLEKQWQEHVVEYHQWLGSRLSPEQVGTSKDVRREVASTLRDYWKTKARMKRSANNRIFFPTV